jgi:hypothetical protein
MRRARVVFLTLGLASIASIARPGIRTASAADAGAEPTGLPACVQVVTESRYVPFGYSHVVVLRNGCARAASCIVSTDVNPEPLPAEVPAGGAAEVVTFLSAAASKFTARVSCRLH